MANVVGSERFEMTRLGKLQKVDLRTAWLSESGHFTPWLPAEVPAGSLQ